MNRNARKLINETFCSLSAEMDLKKITVKEIIKKAGLNRSTFYYYFEDKYDLIHQLQEEKIEEFIYTLQVKPDYELHPSKNKAEEAFPEIFAACEHIRNNKYLYKSWFTDENFISQFSERLASYLGDFSENSIYCAYIAYGTIGFFKKWIESDCSETIEELTMGIIHMSSQSFIIKN